MKASIAAVVGNVVVFLVIWWGWGDAVMGIVLPALAAVLVVGVFGVLCFGYVELTYHYARRCCDIERYRAGQYEHTGTYDQVSTGETINLARWLQRDSVNLGAMPEGELLRKLAEVKDPTGRPRYSRTALSGLLRGSKQDRLAELSEILEQE